MTDPKDATGRRPESGVARAAEAARRRPKFGAGAEGWEAYNQWVERVRLQPGATSRQAVIAKALYSVSSYKTWADKAKGAFDKPK
jgi:hypothetical protein